MNVLNLIFCLIYLAIAPTATHAEGIHFKEIWKKSVSQSPELKISQHELKASEFALVRTQLHWLPSLTLSGTVFSTNDPASNLIGALSQRNISASDFIPAQLNTPGYQTYQNAMLSLNLPLYEGGYRIGLMNTQNSDVQIHQLLLKQKERTLFADTLHHYSNLVSDQNTEKKLMDLKEQVQKILSHYAIGNQSNPVGYSGILGLKGLNHRIDAELISINTSKKNHQYAISEKTSISLSEIQPKEKNVSEVLSAAQNQIRNPLNLESQTLMEEMAQQKEEALSAFKSVERSRFFPKIGLFANESLNHGSRSTGYSTTAGVYLAWSLFNPDHYNRTSEQDERKEAAIAERELSLQTSKIAKSTLNENEITLDKTLSLLMESDQILNEQAKVANRLFQSGSISALQLSEVFNRRVDLILNLRQVEQHWSDLKGKKALLIPGAEEIL